MDTSWLWTPAPGKPSPTTSKSAVAKQGAAANRKAPKGGSKQSNAAPRAGVCQKAKACACKGLGADLALA
eukprot:scaffold79064_cov23-Tisochrysis_lutea.AAC.1